MPKKMIIKGAGSFLVREPSGKEVVTLGTLQNLRIDINTDSENIFGGDGLMPIDTLIREKTIEITATDAKFDLDIVRLMTGDKGLTTGVSDYVWELGESKAVAAIGSGTNEVITLTVVTAPSSDGNITINDFPAVGTDQVVAVLSSDSVEDVAIKIAAALDLVSGFTVTRFNTTVVVTSNTYGDVAENTSFEDTGVTGAAVSVAKTDGTIVSGYGVVLDGAIYDGTIIGCPTASKATVRRKDTNELLTYTSGNPTATEFTYIEGDNKVVVNSALAGIYLSVNYAMSKVVDKLVLNTEDTPFPVRVIHRGTFGQKSSDACSEGGYKMGIETELYAARAKGTFSIDAARATASTSAVSLDVIDPELDGSLGSIKTFVI